MTKYRNADLYAELYSYLRSPFKDPFVYDTVVQVSAHYL
jgi:hypothetical protein